MSLQQLTRATEDKTLWTALIHKIARNWSGSVAHNTYTGYLHIAKSTTLSFKTPSLPIKTSTLKYPLFYSIQHYL